MGITNILILIRNNVWCIKKTNTSFFGHSIIYHYNKTSSTSLTSSVIWMIQR